MFFQSDDIIFITSFNDKELIIIEAGGSHYGGSPITLFYLNSEYCVANRREFAYELISGGLSIGDTIILDSSEIITITSLPNNDIPETIFERIKPKINYSIESFSLEGFLANRIYPTDNNNIFILEDYERNEICVFDLEEKKILSRINRLKITDYYSSFKKYSQGLNIYTIYIESNPQNVDESLCGIYFRDQEKIIDKYDYPPVLHQKINVHTSDIDFSNNYFVALTGHVDNMYMKHDNVFPTIIVWDKKTKEITCKIYESDKNIRNPGDGSWKMEIILSKDEKYIFCLLDDSISAYKRKTGERVLLIREIQAPCYNKELHQLGYYDVKNSKYIIFDIID